MKEKSNKKSSSGAVIALLVIVLIAAAAFFFLRNGGGFGLGGGGGEGIPAIGTDVQIQPPAETEETAGTTDAAETEDAAETAELKDGVIEIQIGAHSIIVGDDQYAIDVAELEDKISHLDREKTSFILIDNGAVIQIFIDVEDILDKMGFSYSESVAGESAEE